MWLCNCKHSMMLHSQFLSGFPGQAMQAISNWWHSSSPQGQSDPKQETLTTRIDSLLFPAGERRIATEDSSLFQLVMSEFFYFEEEVRLQRETFTVVDNLHVFLHRLLLAPPNGLWQEQY